MGTWFIYLPHFSFVYLCMCVYSVLSYVYMMVCLHGICVCVCSYSSMTIRGSRCTILAIVKGDVQVDNGRCTGYLFLKHIRLCIY